MNIQITVDMTPEEVRRLMGLPDVQEFNKEVMNHMVKRLQEGMDGYDPMTIFKSSVVNNTEMFKNWVEMFRNIATTSAKSSSSGNK